MVINVILGFMGEDSLKYKNYAITLLLSDGEGISPLLKTSTTPPRNINKRADPLRISLPPLPVIINK
jgi:hypothetical protein